MWVEMSVKVRVKKLQAQFYYVCRQLVMTLSGFLSQ